MSRTTDLTPVPLIDALLGNRDGSTRQIRFDNLAAQLAGSGAIYNALEEIKAALAGGVSTYTATLTELDGVTGSEGDLGFVLADGTSGNDGVYQFDGSDWIKLTDLPAGFAALSGAGVKTLYEDEDDTNAFTDAHLAKLSGIAAGATVGGIGAITADRHRPSHRDYFHQTVSGPIEDREAVDFGVIRANNVYGQVLEIGGDEIPADPGYLQFAMGFDVPSLPGETWRVRVRYRRSADPVDPASHAVAVFVNNLDKDKALTGQLNAIDTRAPAVADGAQDVEFTVSVDDVHADYAPSGRYWHVLIRTFGTDAAHKVQFIDLIYERITGQITAGERDQLDDLDGYDSDLLDDLIAQIMSDEERDQLADLDGYDSDLLDDLIAQRMSDEEHDQLADLDGWTSTVLSNMHKLQLHRITPNPKTGERAEVLWDSATQTATIGRQRAEMWSDLTNAYRPVFSVDGGSFVYSGDNATEALVIDVSAKEMIVTNLLTAFSDPDLYIPILTISPGGPASPGDVTVLPAELFEDEETTAESSYRPAADIALARQHPAVEQYAGATIIHTAADKVWYAPGGRQGQMMALRQDGFFELSSMPAGSAQDFRATGNNARLYAGLSLKDDSQIYFDNRNDGGDPVVRYNLVTMASGTTGTVKRFESGDISISFDNPDDVPVFSKTDHPIKDKSVIWMGQSPAAQKRNKGWLGGLQRGLANGFLMSAPVTDSIYFAQGAKGSAAIDKRSKAHLTGDAVSNYYTNAATATTDGDAAAVFYAAVDLTELRNQPAIELIDCWIGPGDVDGIILGALTPSQWAQTKLTTFINLRAYIVANTRATEPPKVMITTHGINDKWLALGDADRAALNAAFTKLRIKALELIAENDWIIQGADSYCCDRGLGEAHYTFAANDEWGVRSAPFYANALWDQDNTPQPTLLDAVAGEDGKSLILTFDAPAGQTFLMPSGINGSGVSEAAAPFGGGVVNGANVLHPMDYAQVTGPNEITLYGSLPVAGDRKYVFPIGAESGFVLGTNYVQSVRQAGGAMESTSQMFALPLQTVVKEF